MTDRTIVQGRVQGHRYAPFFREVMTPVSILEDSLASFTLSIRALLEIEASHL